MQMKLIELDHDGGSNWYFSTTKNLVKNASLTLHIFFSKKSKKLNGFLEKYTHPNGICGTTCNTAYLIANKKLSICYKKCTNKCIGI